jgi:hypothetical protein
MNKYKINKLLLFILFFSLISFLADFFNGRFSMVDFEVYYRAANRILAQQKLYQIASDGHYLFHYSPNAGVFFIPFTFFKLNVAKYLYWIFLTLIFFYGLRLFSSLIYKTTSYSFSEKNKDWLIISSLFAVLTHIHLELHLGQVNLLLLIMYLILIYSLYNDRKVLFSLILSISIFIKPFGLIFIPYLIVKGKYRELLLSIFFLVGLSFLPILFYHSFESYIELYTSWYLELNDEINAKQNILSPHNHTIFSIIARFTPLKYILVNKTYSIVYQFMILLSIGVFVLKFITYNTSKSDIISEMSILIGLIPLLAFTNDNAFLFVLPIVVYLAINNHLMNLKIKALFILSCLLIGANIYDLLGENLTLYLSSISIYSFGALILIGIMFDFQKYKSDKNKENSNL